MMSEKGKTFRGPVLYMGPPGRPAIIILILKSEMRAKFYFEPKHISTDAKNQPFLTVD